VPAPKPTWAAEIPAGACDRAAFEESHATPQEIAFWAICHLKDGDPERYRPLFDHIPDEWVEAAVSMREHLLELSFEIREPVKAWSRTHAVEIVPSMLPRFESSLERRVVDLSYRSSHGYPMLVTLAGTGRDETPLRLTSRSLVRFLQWLDRGTGKVPPAVPEVDVVNRFVSGLIESDLVAVKESCTEQLWSELRSEPDRFDTLGNEMRDRYFGLTPGGYSPPLQFLLVHFAEGEKKTGGSIELVADSESGGFLVKGGKLGVSR
jgi:hypothetical protein